MKLPRWALLSLHVVLVFLLLFFVAENYLYVKGYRIPRCHYPRHLDNNNLPDPLCGWSSKPGSRPSVEDPKATITIWPNGQRASRLDPDQQAPERVLVLGCSYTLGMGVDDKSTWVWLLGQRFPQAVFDNYGVMSYGTYQCWLRMRQLLEKQHYDLVIYAYMHDHPRRSTGIELVEQNFGSNDFFQVPYGELRDGQLVCHTAKYINWPGQKQFVLINYLKRVYLGLFSRHNQTQDRQVNQRVFNLCLKQMLDTCNQHNTDFILVSLDESLEHMVDPDLASSLVYKDLSFFALRDAKYHVQQDVRKHPGPLAHRYWAAQLGDWLVSSGYLKEP